MKKKQSRKKDSLIGKFFHTFVGGKIRWQGVVTGEPVTGFFLVQLFDWFFGEPGDVELIPVTQMVGWTFYNDADDWREAGDWKTAQDRSARRQPEVLA